ncbi:hypothetical protein SAMN04487949_2514 [Halogranum gelatinilyticum]|uniref:DUF8215 domain-containing protein n=1 Tax=Halogranum gelatinilyticum TaxID=660521 RepID=A0A1G9VV54_9EURY|nr:hypothetical protein [Halogranum gelatinilyticum]SDM75866.1 hypothetical protein SAMN04487949_2514 [Halogranum gelatinilyticum]
MPPNRGTDLSTEQRQLRPREENDALGTWLEHLFDAASEVFVFTAPVLAVVMLAGDAELTFVAVAALVTMVLGVGLQRQRPLGPPWPKVTPLLGLLRLVVYNVAFAATLWISEVAFTEPVVDISWASGPLVAPSLVAVVLLAALVVAFPYLTVALGLHGTE